jgi:hypothetical protein
MFLMPLGTGGFLHAMWRKLFARRSGQAEPPEPLADIEAVPYEPGSGLADLSPPAAFVKRPVASENAGRHD